MPDFHMESAAKAVAGIKKWFENPKAWVGMVRQGLDRSSHPLKVKYLKQFENVLARADRVAVVQSKEMELAQKRIAFEQANVYTRWEKGEIDARRATREFFKWGRIGGKNKIVGPMFRPLSHDLDKKVMDALEKYVFSHHKFKRPKGHGDLNWQRVRVLGALYNLFDGIVPSPADLRVLVDILGPKFGQSIHRMIDRNGLWRDWVGSIAWNAISLPKTIMASGDFSAVFRQAFLVSVRHPVFSYQHFINNYLPPMFNTLAEPGSTVFVGGRFRTVKPPAPKGMTHAEYLTIKRHERLTQTAEYKFSKEHLGDKAIHISNPTGQAFSEREEVFMSSWPLALSMMDLRGPGVALWPLKLSGKFLRASERGFTTYLNEMRMGLLQRMIVDLQGNPARGLDHLPGFKKRTGSLTQREANVDIKMLADTGKLNTEQLEMLGTLSNDINILTGRGGALLKREDIASMLIFSQRLATSRWQAILIKDPAFSADFRVGLALAPTVKRLFGLARKLRTGPEMPLDLGFRCSSTGLPSRYWKWSESGRRSRP